MQSFRVGDLIALGISSCFSKPVGKPYKPPKFRICRLFAVNLGIQVLYLKNNPDESLAGKGQGVLGAWRNLGIAVFFQKAVGSEFTKSFG